MPNSGYKKIVGRGVAPARQIAKEMASSPRPSASSGSAQRSINDYSKLSPADASGKGQIGYNLFSMGRNSK